MWGTIAAIAGPIIGKMLSGDGEDGDKQGIGTKALEAAIRGEGTRQATDRPLEEIEPAASEEQRNAYLARMIRAIQNNETEGRRSAMEEVAASLMADMRNTEGGRIPDQPVVQPQQPAVQKVEAVELKEPEEEEEEKYEEPFVSSRSSYA